MFKRNKRKPHAFFLVEMRWSGLFFGNDLLTKGFLSRQPAHCHLFFASVTDNSLLLVLSRPPRPTHFRQLRRRRVRFRNRPALSQSRRTLRLVPDTWHIRHRIPDLLRTMPEAPIPKLQSLRIRHLPQPESVLQALVYASLFHETDPQVLAPTPIQFRPSPELGALLEPGKKFKPKRFRFLWPNYLQKVQEGRLRKGLISWGETRNLVLAYPWSTYLTLVAKRQRLLRLVWMTLLFQLTLAVSGLAVIWEMKTSYLQSKYISAWATQMKYHVADGPSDAITFPKEGPYDQRLGYTQLPQFTKTLEERGFVIQKQARQSEAMRQAATYGFFPPYPEKSQAGLHIRDHRGDTLYFHRSPERVFPNFDAIPPLVLKTLLFIENREWMNPPTPHQNPAVEWDRFGRALLDKGIQFVKPNHPVPGGSTLATQLMKFRHSPEGRTTEDRDKLDQMVSASLSAYADGPDTTEARKRIALQYVNSVPLSAVPRFGEVFSLGDGLFAWYGADFLEVMNLLSIPFADVPADQRRAYALNFKRVLGLFIAQRRPTYYLAEDPAALDLKCNSYAGLLVQAGIIDNALRTEVLGVSLSLREKHFRPETPSFIKMKAAQAARTRVLSLLDAKNLYELDRLDLSVDSTLDAKVQNDVNDLLTSLANPEFVAANGLLGKHLLGSADLSGVIYSFTLYEKTPRGNILRVQTDTVNQPLNYSEGVKLDLGSTAKLRTLLTYLQIIADLYDRFAPLKREQWLAEQAKASDILSQWTLDFLLKNGAVPLDQVLDAALARKYSASPGEAFFTGGGMHTFHNFNGDDNGRILPLKEGFKHSVNLVFIRLMREIVQYHIAQITDRAKSLDRMDPQDRQYYLTRFADLEGTSFLRNFYRKYKDKPAEEREIALLQGIRPLPHRMATALLSLNPNLSLEQFSTSMRRYLPTITLSVGDLASLHKKYAKDKFNLQDRGYIARCHPLELWLVEYLNSNPNAKWSDIEKAGYDVRQEVYKWLFRSSRMQAQNKRIRTMLEMEAFVHIHEQWRKLGYPFESLTPSYATSIGSSGDRPAALGDLMGIILNDGIRKPPARLEKLHFAQDTPYETLFVRAPTAGTRVMHAEVARAARSAMADVVAGGTASRVKTAFTNAQGKPLTVIGKTGTGDHRREVYGSRGRLISSVVLNRTATFAFIIDERLFGVITAHVPGQEAGNYTFTSSLPLAVLKLLAPRLAPLIDRQPEPELPQPQLPSPQAEPVAELPEAELADPNALPAPETLVETDPGTTPLEPLPIIDLVPAETAAPLTDAEQAEIKNPEAAPTTEDVPANPPR